MDCGRLWCRARKEGVSGETIVDVDVVGEQSTHIHAKRKVRQTTDPATYPSLSNQHMLCLCMFDLLQRVVQLIDLP